jgi:hypothetical protein
MSPALIFCLVPVGSLVVVMFVVGEEDQFVTMYCCASISIRIKKGKFGSIPLKDHHFGSILLLSHLHVGPHESMTCGVHGIYLKFGSFNGIDPIVP